MKKLRVIIFSLILALIMPITSFASTDNGTLGAGEWDIILKSNYTVYDYPDVTKTRTVLSGGGDLRICMSGINYGNEIIVEVRSDDALDRTITYKTFVGYQSGSSSKICSEKIDVREYKDGDYAEIYLQMQGMASTDTVTVYIED